MILESLMKIKQKQIQLQFRNTSIMDIIWYQNPTNSLSTLSSTTRDWNTEKHKEKMTYGVSDKDWLAIYTRVELRLCWEFNTEVYLITASSDVTLYFI